MKKRMAALLLALALLLSLAACGPKSEEPTRGTPNSPKSTPTAAPTAAPASPADASEPPAETPSAPTEAPEVTPPVPGDESAPMALRMNRAEDRTYVRDLCASEASCETLELTDASAYPALAAALADFGEALTESAFASAEGMASDIEDYDEESLQYLLPFYEHDSCRPLRADSAVLSFVHYLDIYGGGAHGYYHFTGYNFDPATGEPLQLSDVITDEDAFFELVKAALKEWDGSDAEPDEPTYIGEWTVGNQGITVYYNVYELGSYAMGYQAVFLSYEKLGGLVAEKYRPTADNWAIPVWCANVCGYDGDGDGKTDVISTWRGGFSDDDAYLLHTPQGDYVYKFYDEAEPGYPVYGSDRPVMLDVWTVGEAEDGYCSMDFVGSVYGRPTANTITDPAHFDLTIAEREDGSEVAVRCSVGADGMPAAVDGTDLSVCRIEVPETTAPAAPENGSPSSKKGGKAPSLSWVELPAGAEWIDKSELQFWDDWFDGDSLRRQMLYSTYARPEEVDLCELFYNGLGSDAQPCDLTDVRAHLMKYGYWNSNVSAVKLPVSQMNRVLEEYLDLHVADTEGIGLARMTYVPETDAYYCFHGDTNAQKPPHFEAGYRSSDELCLFYDGEASVAFGWESGWFRVKLSESGKGIFFLANESCRLSDDGVEYFSDPYRPDWVYEEPADIQVSTLTETESLCADTRAKAEANVRKLLEGTVVSSEDWWWDDLSYTFLAGRRDGKTTVFFISDSGYVVELGAPENVDPESIGFFGSSMVFQYDVFAPIDGMEGWYQSWEYNFLIPTGELFICETMW